VRRLSPSDTLAGTISVSSCGRSAANSPASFAGEWPDIPTGYRLVADLPRAGRVGANDDRFGRAVCGPVASGWFIFTSCSWRSNGVQTGIGGSFYRWLVRLMAQIGIRGEAGEFALETFKPLLARPARGGIGRADPLAPGLEAGSVRAQCDFPRACARKARGRPHGGRVVRKVERRGGRRGGCLPRSIHRAGGPRPPAARVVDQPAAQLAAAGHPGTGAGHHWTRSIRDR
jgi:hypothetical protein